MHDDGILKRAMTGMTESNRSRGRSPRRWDDDVVEWCGCTFPEVATLTQTDETGKIKSTNLLDATACEDVKMKKCVILLAGLPSYPHTTEGVDSMV